jgi:hypothetical protein
MALTVERRVLQVGQFTQAQILQAIGMRPSVDKNRFPCKVSADLVFPWYASRGSFMYQFWFEGYFYIYGLDKRGEHTALYIFSSTKKLADRGSGCGKRHGALSDFKLLNFLKH